MTNRMFIAYKNHFPCSRYRYAVHVTYKNKEGKQESKIEKRSNNLQNAKLQALKFGDFSNVVLVSLFDTADGENLGIVIGPANHVWKKTKETK